MCCFKLNLTFLGIAVGEGQVVCFLLASSGILYLRTSLQGGSNVPKVCPLFHRRYLQFATSVFVSVFGCNKYDVILKLHGIT